MPDPFKSDECELELGVETGLSPELPEIVRAVTATCGTGECFEHLSPVPLPSREKVREIVQLARQVLFPGYFTWPRLDPVSLEYQVGLHVTRLYDLLADQITWAVRHDCHRYQTPCLHCQNKGQDIALDFVRRLPELRRVLGTDVRAAFDGDPASPSHDEIIFSYPGLYAISVQRMAHLLHQAQVPLIPRIMTEQAHSLTGIDIHPGARIGSSFFIDHGTGVVIGETAEIGERVRLYQGVTLGALSIPREEVEELRRRKRHPTIEDDVIVYSGATILGGRTRVGARSVIGGNVWITESVPPDTKVILKTPDQLVINSGSEP